MFGYFNQNSGQNSGLASTLDLTHFDTSKVTDMSGMFEYFANASTTPPTLDLTHFDTSKVTDMSGMFVGFESNSATPLTLDLAHFDTSQVTNMSNMFSGFGGYNSTMPPTLDLTHFDTSKVTDMSGMFGGFSSASTTPPTLDLTHFDTSQVTNMSNMFGGFSNNSATPPTLDLTHFDTSQVTDMSGMFSNYAQHTLTPPTLDLTHFDVSKVTNMSMMFYYFARTSTTPVTLDLSWWKIGAAPGGTGVQQMFLSDSLAEIHIESGVFSNATITYSLAMFPYTTNLKVYVGTAADQAWIYGLVGNGAPPAGTVTVAGAPSGTQPAPLPVVPPKAPLPPLPPVPFTPQTTITDTIPDGLTITPSTITGTQSAASAASAITWQRSGQTITWSVPNAMLPADVSVSVTVDTISSTLPVGTVFENTAQVRSTATNTTYHGLTEAPVVVKHKVTYVDYDGTILSTQEVADGGNAIPPADPSRPGYRFIGWSSDGTNITKDTTITALYTAIGTQDKKTPPGSSLPDTGDSVLFFTPWVVAVAGALSFVLRPRRRRA